MRRRGRAGEEKLRRGRVERRARKVGIECRNMCSRERQGRSAEEGVRMTVRTSSVGRECEWLCW